MEIFCMALEDCSLSDLGFKGSKYTWNNGRSNVSFMKECLNRAVANKEWCSLSKRWELRCWLPSPLITN
jgi:hypothetical protein